MIAGVLAAMLLFAPAPKTTAPTPTTSDDSSDPGWGVVIGGVLGGLAVGAGAAAVVVRRRPTRTRTGYPAPPAHPAPAAPPAPVVRPAPPAREGQDRATLVAAMVDLRDALPSPVLGGRVDQALTTAGVVVIAPRQGDAFDANAHRAVQVQPTPPGQRAGTVAELIRVGYADGGRILRPADVDVYQGGSP